QVHAVPRGDALDRPATRADRGGRRDYGRPRAAAEGLRPRRGGVALRARRLRGLAGAELLRQVARRGGRPPRAGALSVRRRGVARGDLRAARPAHALARRDGAGVSSPELVTVTIDGREVQVPKGTGLVETALAAGIEIPVFCYEPRLGAPIGACRMCLVEV